MEILARSSLRGPCMKILQMPLVGGSWEVLVSRSCKILSSSSRSWQEDLGQGLLQFLVRRACGDPSEMLSGACAWSCTGPCEKLLKRSWWNPLGVLEWPCTRPWEDLLESWNPPQEVLGLRSWRCSALVLVWKFVWDAHSKFLYEDLARSSI